MKISIFLVTIASLLPSVLTRTDCINVDGSNGVKYALFFEDISWTKAQDKCQQYNGTLAAINIYVCDLLYLNLVVIDIWIGSGKCPFKGQCYSCPSTYGTCDCNSNLNGYLCENVTSPTSCQIYSSTVNRYSQRSQETFSITPSSSEEMKNTEQWSTSTTESDQDLDTSTISDTLKSHFLTSSTLSDVFFDLTIYPSTESDILSNQDINPSTASSAELSQSSELYTLATSTTENLEPSESITIETSQKIERFLMSQSIEQLIINATAEIQITDIHNFSESIQITSYSAKLASLNDESSTNSVILATKSADLSSVEMSNVSDSNTIIRPMLSVANELINSNHSFHTTETILTSTTTESKKTVTNYGQLRSPSQCPYQCPVPLLLKNHHQEAETNVIDCTSVSSYKRKLYSVYDPRVTAIIIGNTGIILLVVVLSIIAVPDFLSLLCYLHGWCSQDCIKGTSAEQKKRDRSID